MNTQPIQAIQAIQASQASRLTHEFSFLVHRPGAIPQTKVTPKINTTHAIPLSTFQLLRSQYFLLETSTLPPMCPIS